MLKIWLTWLQPSLGILGTALVLSNPLCSNAADKPVVGTKVSTQPLQWSGVRSAGTKIDRQLLNGIAVTPDIAVRQLAIGAMGTTGLQPNNFTSKIPQRSQKAISSFVSSSRRAKPLATKAMKPQHSKNTVAAALALANKPSSMVPVPGLYIGNTDVRVSDRFFPAAKPLSRSTGSAAEIGSPTPMSAMMTATSTVDPFPVVRPELMQKLQGTGTFAQAPAVRIAPYSLDPIATIPAVRSRVATPQLLNFKAAPARSLDPIAAIPTGLQKLLGNNLDSQPTVATAVARKPSSFLALKQLVAPSNTILSASVTGSSLQLATSQAYLSSVPQFSIPGETILSSKPAKPVASLQMVKRVQNDSTVAVAERKSNYILMSDRQLTFVKKQSWMTADRPSSLGGLILGSQPVGMIPKVVSLLPASNIVN